MITIGAALILVACRRENVIAESPPSQSGFGVNC